MIKKVSGRFGGRGRRFGIVVSRFNEHLTRELLEGALDTLTRHGAREKDIRVVHVPGAFEIPLALKKLLRETTCDAVITLAVVIRGQTKHFDQVAAESARAVQEQVLKTDVPIIFGMIFAENTTQAIERVGVKQMNKGREWALAALEMADLMKQKL